MHLARPDGTVDHLCYCTNIHPGEHISDVLHNLRTFTPGIRDALVGSAPFALGLRLSAAATAELATPARLDELRAFLHDENCYVPTINGFPYGTFHGTRVKESVYLPDWTSPARLSYTNQLADVLAALLPEGQTGSISTVPGAFKASVSSAADVACMAGQLVDHVAHLVALEQNTGHHIVLALEPEPCCFLETVDEAHRFFRDHLFAGSAIAQLQGATGASAAQAEAWLRAHLTLCLDLCHAAVEFEDPDTCYAQLDAAGIAIGKLQISAGLSLPEVNAESVTALEPFIDTVYLHQVVERRDGRLYRFTDLPEAIASLEHHQGAREWRVHFHVPVFLDDLGAFASTQGFIVDALARHRQTPLSRHLEVETYTFDVLPPHHRSQSVESAIVRELTWVTDQLDRA